MAKFSRLEVYNAILEQGLIPIHYNPDLEVMKRAIVASYEGGARIFEMTNRGDNAWLVFTELIRYFQKELPDLILGAGSILDPGTASLYMSSGSNFIVGSVYNPEVAKICNRRKVGYIPGCGTASEISDAEEMGSEFIKIFPGTAVGGPGFIKALLGPTPWTRILVTGGVDASRESLLTWFKAGANAVGMGSNLITKDWIANNNYGKISETIATVLKWIREARGQNTAYGVEHIGIYPQEAGGAQAIVDWYSNVFGLRIKEGSSSIFLEGDNAGRLEIMKSPADVRTHVAISVSDFEDAVRKLQEKGIALENPNIKSHVKAVYLKNPDPAGNLVHLLWRKP